MVDFDRNPTKLIDLVETGKQMLVTRLLSEFALLFRRARSSLTKSHSHSDQWSQGVRSLIR